MLDEHSGKIVGGLVSAVVAGFVWLVRTVFTNQKALALLEQKQDMQHEELKTAVAEIRRSNSSALKTQSKIVEMLEKMADK